MTGSDVWWNGHQAVCSSDSLQGVENAAGIEAQGETSATSLKSQLQPVGVQSQPPGESLTRR